MLKITLCLWLILIPTTSALMASEPTIVKLTPPKLTPETLSEHIVCTRPMREGKFNISYESKGSKEIINCYGHGGAGWTTLFGSVSKAIDLFQEANSSKETPIRVIGAGCMGLTCAIELHRLGYNVTGIVTKDLYDSPSWLAAGYFAVVSVRASPEEQEVLAHISMKSFIGYQLIEKGLHPYISTSAVRFMPVYCSAQTPSGVEDLEENGLIPPREEVTLDFGDGVLRPGYVKYMTYFINTSGIMRELIAEVERLGIPIVTQELQSFDELSEPVIFNCCGLGARELNQDQLMIPVRGHLVTLNDLSGVEHMDYMIFSKVKQEGKDEYIYMFPKNLSVTPEHIDGIPCKGVLGGTFIPHVDKLSPEEEQQLDQREFKRMLDRNSEFFYGHPY